MLDLKKKSLVRIPIRCQARNSVIDQMFYESLKLVSTLQIYDKRTKFERDSTKNLDRCNNTHTNNTRLY